MVLKCWVNDVDSNMTPNRDFVQRRISTSMSSGRFQRRILPKLYTVNVRNSCVPLRLAVMRAPSRISTQSRTGSNGMRAAT